MELAFDREQVCIEIYTSDLFLAMVLISRMPVVGILRVFFLLELQQCSSERGMLDMLYLVGFLLWYQLPPFSPP
jgi:hypothetical protein